MTESPAIESTMFESRDDGVGCTVTDIPPIQPARWFGRFWRLTSRRMSKMSD